MKVLIYPNWVSNNYYLTLLTKNLEHNGAEIHFCPNLSVLDTLSKESKGMDVVHLHWVPFLFGTEHTNWFKFLFFNLKFYLDLFFIKKIKKKRLVWTIHNLYAHENHHFEAEKRASRYLARCCDVLISHSKSEIPRIAAAYGVPESKIVFIPHGHYIGRYAEGMSRQEARKRLGLADDDFVFLYFGIIRRYKGLDHLIHAFQALDFDNKKLLIAGNAYDKGFWDEIKDQCTGDIIANPTFIPDEDVQLYMNAADAVVLPFTNVLTSGSAILAMSFHKMVIAPRLGALPDYLDEKNNVLYNDSDMNGLADALQKAVTLDAVTCGKNNFTEAQKLDWHSIAKETVHCYQDTH
jgi:glycosyltransferase involved in cell wall biosynthesis